MIGTSSRWKCEACGVTVAASHKGNHIHWQCPNQGNGRKKREEAEARAAQQAMEPKFWQYLQCMCGCGEQVGQVKGKAKKHFVDTKHYERHRSVMRSKQGRIEAKAVTKEAEEAEATERRLAAELAPLVVRREHARREADGVRLVTGEASFLLWAACLGFNAGDVAPVAA